MTVVERVSSASTLLGLLLVLVTLFTSEQARSLDAEENRTGGGRRGAYRRITLTTTALAAVTSLSVFSLAGLAYDVVRLCCGNGWDSSLAVFVLVFVLLLPLAGWQFHLARAAWRLWH
jgi:hypothetical protein